MTTLSCRGHRLCSHKNRTISSKFTIKQFIPRQSRIAAALNKLRRFRVAIIIAQGFTGINESCTRLRVSIIHKYFFSDISHQLRYCISFIANISRLIGSLHFAPFKVIRILMIIHNLSQCCCQTTCGAMFYAGTFRSLQIIRCILIPCGLNQRGDVRMGRNRGTGNCSSCGGIMISLKHFFHSWRGGLSIVNITITICQYSR